jgi:hypothetical protein
MEVMKPKLYFFVEDKLFMDTIHNGVYELQTNVYKSGVWLYTNDESVHLARLRHREQGTLLTNVQVVEELFKRPKSKRLLKAFFNDQVLNFL